jgi:hypothetical protein
VSGHTLTLRRGGTYSSRAESDAIEPAETGEWDFWLTSDSTGCLVLSPRSAYHVSLGPGSVVRFARSDSVLRVWSSRFRRGPVIQYDSTESARQVTDLTVLPDPPLYTILLSTVWKLASHVTHPRSPARMAFTRDARLTEMDDDGRCTSVSGFDLTGGALNIEWQWGSCDSRATGAGHRGTMGGGVGLVDGLLGTPYGVYRPAGDRDSLQVVRTDLRGLFLRAEFPAHVAPGHVFTIRLALQNQSGCERALKSIGIGHERWGGDSFSLVPYYLREYHDLRLAPAAWYRDSIVVSLDAAQIASVPVLFVDSWDRRQPYDDRVRLRGLAGR